MKLKFLLLLLVTGVSLLGQNWVRVDSLFSPSGVGAFHFTAPHFTDLNNDGYADLLLGNTDVVCQFYENTGENLPPKFAKNDDVLASLYANGQQGTNSYYPTTADFDNDGDLDLVIGGYNGLIYYENSGDQFNPEWTKVDTMFDGVNPFIGTDPKPAFADLDNDGDYDLFVGAGETFGGGGPEAGTVLSFINNGTKEQPYFVQYSSFASGIPDIGLNAYPTFADLDNDGLIDLLLGRDLKTLVYLRNTGTDKDPVWTNSSGTFNFVDQDTYWKNPQLYDIDRDGDFDLIYGTDGGKLYMYENTGSVSAPSFTYNGNYFSIIKNKGSGATVSFADYDNDGDYDFISGNWFGHLNYFENTGDVGNPRYKLSTAAFSNLDPGSSYSTPLLYDIDGDGDHDILTGALSKKLVCWVNNGTSFTLNNTWFAGITAGWSSNPALGDLNGDGEPDLLMNGEDSGDFKCYINEGNFTWTENTELFSGINVPVRASLRIADPDADGDLDIIVGKSFGQLMYLENVGDATKPIYQQNDDLLDGIEVNQNAVADFADLNGDTKPDMIIAEYNGNFSYYINNFAVTDVNEETELSVLSYELYQNYPNPFNPVTSITYSLPESADVKLTVFDMLGREVAVLVNSSKNSGSHTMKFDASDLASGIYIYKLNAGSFVQTRKMMLLK